MSNLTIRDIIGTTPVADKKPLNIDYLISLECALDALEIPWIKGIRITHLLPDDGIYFNKDVGENIIAVLVDGITMPTILNTKFGVELCEDTRTTYTYEELFVQMIDVTGPKFAKIGIEKLKEIAKLAIS